MVILLVDQLARQIKLDLLEGRARNWLVGIAVSNVYQVHKVRILIFITHAANITANNLKAIFPEVHVGKMLVLSYGDGALTPGVSHMLPLESVHFHNLVLGEHIGLRRAWRWRQSGLRVLHDNGVVLTANTMRSSEKLE